VSHTVALPTVMPCGGSKFESRCIFLQNKKNSRLGLAGGRWYVNMSLGAAWLAEIRTYQGQKTSNQSGSLGFYPNNSGILFKSILWLCELACSPTIIRSNGTLPISVQIIVPAHFLVTFSGFTVWNLQICQVLLLRHSYR
jgi:hypothetical protein